MSASQRRRLEAVREHDQVARWFDLQRTYPDSRYVMRGPFFYGKLRPEDDELNHASLKGLIDLLLSREKDSAPQ